MMVYIADTQGLNWQGTDDIVYSIANAKEEIELFKNAKAADLVVVEGGAHLLGASHPKEVDDRVIDFVGRWAKGW